MLKLNVLGSLIFIVSVIKDQRVKRDLDDDESRIYLDDSVGSGATK